MKVALYILGILDRHGPMHGYAIKQLLSDEAAHFAHLKLPTIYYHLDKLEKNGHILASREQSGNRPDRTVYSLTPEGTKKLQDLLEQSMETVFEPDFIVDAVFYLGHLLDKKDIHDILTKRSDNIKQKLEKLIMCRQDKDKTLNPQAQPFAHTIFRHHEYHLIAELEWIKETKERFS